MYSAIPIMLYQLPVFTINLQSNPTEYAEMKRTLLEFLTFSTLPIITFHSTNFRHKDALVVD